MIMDNFNCNIGQQETGEDKECGKHDCGKRNKRGERLIQFAIQNK